MPNLHDTMSRLAEPFSSLGRMLSWKIPREIWRTWKRTARWEATFESPLSSELFGLVTSPCVSKQGEPDLTGFVLVLMMPLEGHENDYGRAGAPKYNHESCCAQKKDASIMQLCHKISLSSFFGEIYWEPFFFWARQMEGQVHDRGAVSKVVKDKEEALMLHDILKLEVPGFCFRIGCFQKLWYPKSSILIGFSIINHPFWGTPIFGNT